MLYFDHNATTFVAPEVADTLNAATRQVFGNASSTHREGQKARQQMEMARRTVADYIGSTPPEIVFTSGGTESNNLAILGLVRNIQGAGKHVLTTAMEHPSVLEACRQLEREGVDVTYLPANRNGAIDSETVQANVRPSTVLVSVMHANNETGVLQPISSIAKLVTELRLAGQKIFLHSDGVQALGKVNVNVQQTCVDLYSISAHKVFGPKGVGGLFVRKGTPLRGIQFGGRHERERRAGTENVPAAMAFARALDLYEAHEGDRVRGLRDSFERQVLYRIPEARINGASDQRLPNTSNLLFPDLSGEALVIALDMRGIAVSTGSACSSGSIEPSHVLLAMGRSANEARRCVRFSFGRYNTPEDVEILIEALVASVQKLRRTARLEQQVVA